VLKDSTVYLTGNLLQKAAAFILIPVYTHYLTTAQYGLVELANSVVNLLLIGIAVMVPNAINKCYHRDCSSDEERKRLIGTALAFTALSSGTFCLVAMALEGFLAPRLFASPEAPMIYRFTLLWAFLAQLAVIPFEFLRTTGRSLAFVWMSLSQLAVQFGVTLYLIVVRGMQLWGVLIGAIAGLALVGVLAIASILHRITWRLDRALLRTLLSFGAAMIPVFLSGWVINLSDRFFLQSFAGLGALGIYSLGYKFGTLVNLLLAVPLQRAWTPIFFRMADEPGAPAHLSRLATWLVAGLNGASLAITLAVPPFLRASATPEFHSAAGIVPFICLAYLFSGLANCLGNGLIVRGKVRLIAAYSALAAVLNLALNALLIPALGIYGAAGAAILAFAAQLLGTVLSLSRHYPLPLEWKRMVIMVLTWGMVVSAAFLLPVLDLLTDVIVRGALFLLFPGILLALKILRLDHLRAVARWVASIGPLRDRQAG
jgi:O-antigen/teichoic acid export membrane protein